ncbi:cellulase family glycosylhydrolase [Carboxylicivirga sp. A043]|uniref:glycoside hydrolase family 5 protein n=1 Tax=Carboxylicivirga litoralis TaxID=2816963 RepID=UPI0021CB6DBD|nr:glycoside hydrolase family 5 protein [Carboxylicivirga sp. A043]MCU4157275.1 cellulase family glycosylhydrolase [Carboxylicivirga sp. A043]
MLKRLIKNASLLLVIVLLSCQSESGSGNGYFTTNASRLLDANNNAFVLRGVNVPHAWHPEASFEALDVIAANKVNCVRIVWETRLPASGLDSILQKCIDLEMIPMVELHNATGDSTETKLLKLAAYYTSDEMLYLYRKYEKYLLINIANEWGENTMNDEYWRDAYKKSIQMLREAGYRSTIVIDASGWGQNSSPILKYGQALIDFDSAHNLLFSVHMYGSWNDKTKIENDLKDAHAKQLPLIVGEFGYNFSEGENNLGCKVDHQQILKTCDALKMGYLAWSWTGNNEENKWLDLVEYSDWQTPTWWGKEILNSPLGIRQTAVKASVFN